MSEGTSGTKSSDPISATPAIPAALLAAILVVVYFGLFNHDFSVNALRYAGDVEQGANLFHPNHLLPGALYGALYAVVRALGGGAVRAIWVMQAANALAGIAAAAAIAATAARRADATRALLIALLYAVGFAAWNFAEEADVYVLPAAAVAVSFAVLQARPTISWPALAALAALAVFAVLTLQQYVFWYPALLALAARRDLGAARAAKLRALASAVPLACLLAYVAAGLATNQLRSPSDALGWFLGYAWNPSHGGFGTYRPAPAPGARLLGALLGLGNLAFAYEVVLSRFAPVAALLGGGALVWLAASGARALRDASAAVRTDAAVIALWGAANLAFATWWESRNIEFLFPVWLAAGLLAALAAPRLDRRLLGAALLLVGGVNLSVAFLPQRVLPERYRVAAELARHVKLTPADVLVTEEFNTVEWLHYFERVDVRFAPGAVSAAMQASIDVARARDAIDAALATGARVYTTELDERGRLRELARRFAPLGRDGFDGAVDRDIDALYRGLDVAEAPVPGVRRVRARK